VYLTTLMAVNDNFLQLQVHSKGLVGLELGCDFTMSNETWDAVCDSLKTHPTLQVLHLWSLPFARAVVAPRIQALLDMMKENTSIQTISLRHSYSDHELFRGSVIPYLETNRLRSRLFAIQKTRPIAYRAKLLGRALLSLRTDPNSFWSLLSGNPEVALPSTSTTIAAAVRLPTPAAAAAATSTANVAAAASVLPALTTTATGGLPKAAAPAATSATTAFASDPTASAAAASVAGQKRKSRP
jgi:hypothetical protein